jgi:hypothetical protein
MSTRPGEHVYLLVLEVASYSCDASTATRPRYFFCRVVTYYAVCRNTRCCCCWCCQRRSRNVMSHAAVSREPSTRLQTAALRRRRGGGEGGGGGGVCPVHVHFYYVIVWLQETGFPYATYRSNILVLTLLR